MENLKHTPGKWKLTMRKETNFYYITAPDETSNSPRDLKIVSIEGGAHPDKGYSDRLEANAKLIAAAPELLATLILLKALYPYSTNIQALCTEAIQKATE